MKKSVPGYVLSLLLFVISTEVFAHAPIAKQITLVSEEIKRDPTNTELYLKRAELYHFHQDWQLAKTDVESILKIDKDHFQAQLLLAGIYLGAGNFSKAILTSTQLLQLSPASVKARWVRAQAYENIGTINDALSDYSYVFKHVKKLKPGHVTSYARAVLSMEKSQWPRAISILDKGMSRLGKLVTLQTLAIEIERELQDYSSALSRAEKLLDQSNNKAIWLSMIADIHHQANNPLAALKIYQSARDALGKELSQRPSNANLIGLGKHISKRITLLKLQSL